MKGYTKEMHFFLNKIAKTKKRDGFSLNGGIYIEKILVKKKRKKEKEKKKKRK